MGHLFQQHFSSFRHLFWRRFCAASTTVDKQKFRRSIYDESRRGCKFWFLCSREPSYSMVQLQYFPGGMCVFWYIQNWKNCEIMLRDLYTFLILWPSFVAITNSSSVLTLFVDGHTSIPKSLQNGSNWDQKTQQTKTCTTKFSKIFCANSRRLFSDPVSDSALSIHCMEH